MNYDRIHSALDVDRMQASHVTIVGGAYGLARDLVHCGLGRLTLVDFDRIEERNVSRQDFDLTDVGRFKVEANAAALKRMNPEVQVDYLVRDFCALSDDEVDEHLGQCDLLVFATDHFPAQARGNLEALRLRKPALWIGLYKDARAGEIVYTAPRVTQACYRCICRSRYDAFHHQANGGISAVQVPSTGGTILDLHLVDAVAGQIALGLLTAGAPNRFGRLIGQLGQRNLLQIKIDPDYRLGSHDLFGQYLGHDPAQFAWNTIALTMEPERDCPDCAAIRRAVQETSSCA